MQPARRRPPSRARLAEWARLGQHRISECTYYDNAENIRAIKYPYEIVGMYMNVKKKNEGFAWKPYFLPGEIFGNRASVWQGKEGLMIWPREHRATEVARLLTDFALHRTKQDNQDRGDN